MNPSDSHHSPMVVPNNQSPCIVSIARGFITGEVVAGELIAEDVVETSPIVNINREVFTKEVVARYDTVTLVRWRQTGAAEVGGSGGSGGGNLIQRVPQKWSWVPQKQKNGVSMRDAKQNTYNLISIV